MIRSPYIRAFWRDQELSDRIESMTYAYSEEDDDLCEITLRSSDKNAPDLPQFQEREQWRIIWGYIGEEVNNRLITLENISWDYEGAGIKASIKATDVSSAKLKRSYSKQVHKKTTLLGLAMEYAEKHNMTLELDANHEPIVERLDRDKTTGQLKLTFKGSFKPVTKKVPVTKEEFKKWMADQKKGAMENAYGRGNFYKTMGDQFYSRFDYDMKKADEVRRWLAGLKYYDSIPQANRSDKQLLDEVGMREPGGPFIAETRDNTLTIKKRNFGQKPYRSYEWGGGQGNLITFTPESKNTAKSGNSYDVGFSGWNPQEHTFFSGVAGAEGTNDPVLNSFIEISPNGRNDKATIFYRKESTQSTWQSATPSDETNVAKLVTLEIDNQVAGQPLSAVEKKLRELYSPGEANPLGAYGLASNLRNRSELQRNPAKATIEGDPNIKAGMIITIFQVATKYLGNYYITKCTHSINPNQEYVCNLEMVRQGHNIKATDAHKTPLELDRQKNNQVGDSGKKNETKPLEIKQNK